jgi:SynChlorMet cassette radical SAM/SPASM protein ScmF
MKELDLPEGVPTLNSLYLYISGSCNLACRHCWIEPSYQAGESEGRYVEVDSIHKAIQEAKPLGLKRVKLTGGEPMLHPQFREIVSLISSKGLRIQVETNGTLIDHKLAKFLKDTKRLSFISVSVDGADAKTHECLRVLPGSFEASIKGIKNLVDQGFRPQLICTLHKGNISQIVEVIEMAKNLGCGSVKFNHIQEIGRGEHFIKENGLKVSEIINLYHSLENGITPKASMRIHFDIPFAFYSIRKLLNDNLGTCTIKNILGILSTGEFSLCGIGVTVPELIYGNIKKDSLREVWCHSPGLIRLRHQIPQQLEGICGQCLHKDVCLGSCVANNFYTAGKLNAPCKFCETAENLGLFPESRKRKPVE